MFVIFGIAARTTRKSSGSFHCPYENKDASYEEFHESEWFSLFFIPLVKVRDHLGYVECRNCGSRYPTAILKR
jgi:transcription elongation factor Elf1